MRIGSRTLDVGVFSHTMKVMDNKGNRRFERTDFHVKGFISCGNEECPVSVINISLKGILVTLDHRNAPEIGKDYPLRISLPHSDISINTIAKLMHRENGQYGFRFDSVEADGMIHLRRLLELNITSEDEIDRELGFLID
jgi:hypothetical protein